MTVPSTNVKFSDVWSEANGAYTSGSLSLSAMSYYSYFSGPNELNTVPDNNWGQGESSGADRILGTTPKTTNIRVNDFRGLTYFYNQSQFKILINVKNNGAVPNDDEVNVNVTLFDSTSTYSYVTGGQLVDAGDNVNFDISLSTTPIIAIAYWLVGVETTSFATVTSVNITINNEVKVNGGALGIGTTTFFDSTTYGNVAADISYDGINCSIEIN
jgi:hypothetical protein